MDILSTLLKLIIMIVVPVVTSVLTYAFKRYVDNLIDANLKGKTAEDLKKGLEVIANSVDYIQQTYVDSLKQEQGFTKEAQQRALAAAKERAMDLMNNEIQNAITSTYGNIDEYVETTIESIIRQNKKGA